MDLCVCKKWEGKSESIEDRRTDMETEKAERRSENGEKERSTVVCNFPSVNLGVCTHACICRFFTALKLI